MAATHLMKLRRFSLAQARAKPTRWPTASRTSTSRVPTNPHGRYADQKNSVRNPPQSATLTSSTDHSEAFSESNLPSLATMAIIAGNFVVEESIFAHHSEAGSIPCVTPSWRSRASSVTDRDFDRVNICLYDSRETGTSVRGVSIKRRLGREAAAPAQF